MIDETEIPDLVFHDVLCPLCESAVDEYNGVWSCTGCRIKWDGDGLHGEYEDE